MMEKIVIPLPEGLKFYEVNLVAVTEAGGFLVYTFSFSPSMYFQYSSGTGVWRRIVLEENP